VKYNWSKKSGGQDVRSSETAGSCKRELFECDRHFAHGMLSETDVYSDDYSSLYSNWDNRDSENCPSSNSGGPKRECCGGKTYPYFLYQPSKLSCCDDGIPRISC
jgi:hypothetical protein